MPRNLNYSLGEVLFYEDLKALLSVGECYMNKLCNAKPGSPYDQGFPKPMFRTPSGIRVWRLRDVELWVRSIRSRKPTSRVGRPLLERGVTVYDYHQGEAQ